MGFNIKEKIETVLTYEDIALIAVALGMYQNAIGDKTEEMSIHAAKLVNRLGYEMSNVK